MQASAITVVVRLVHAPTPELQTSTLAYKTEVTLWRLTSQARSLKHSKEEYSYCNSYIRLQGWPMHLAEKRATNQETISCTTQASQQD